LILRDKQCFEKQRLKLRPQTQSKSLVQAILA
jgi:hypothetical protein